MRHTTNTNQFFSIQFKDGIYLAAANMRISSSKEEQQPKTKFTGALRLNLVIFLRLLLVSLMSESLKFSVKTILYLSSLSLRSLSVCRNLSRSTVFHRLLLWAARNQEMQTPDAPMVRSSTFSLRKITESMPLSRVFHFETCLELSALSITAQLHAYK